MTAGARIQAWRPAVRGVGEVFHANFVDHSYPLHTHESWTLLIVDSGVIGYELAGHEHGSMTDVVTLLPPHLPHNGRTVQAAGFRKRVIYLDADVLAGIGSAADTPTFRDPLLRNRIDSLHRALATPGDELEAESRLAFIRGRLQGHLDADPLAREPGHDGALAGRLRELLDSRIREGLTLADAGAELHADPTHLIRSFSRAFGIPPHRYLLGRRIELARRLLLAGSSPAHAAADTGFHDQSHFHRHFVTMIGTTPARYARSGPDHRT